MVISPLSPRGASVPSSRMIAHCTEGATGPEVPNLWRAGVLDEITGAASVRP